MKHARDCVMILVWADRSAVQMKKPQLATGAFQLSIRPGLGLAAHPAKLARIGSFILIGPAERHIDRKTCGLDETKCCLPRGVRVATLNGHRSFDGLQELDRLIACSRLGKFVYVCRRQLVPSICWGLWHDWRLPQSFGLTVEIA